MSFYLSYLGNGRTLFVSDTFTDAEHPATVDDYGNVVEVSPTHKRARRSLFASFEE